MEGCREEEKERDRAGATDRHLRSHALALKLQRFLVLFLCCALRAFCVFLFPAYRSSVHAHIDDIDDHLHHVHEDCGKAIAPVELFAILLSNTVASNN